MSTSTTRTHYCDSLWRRILSPRSAAILGVAAILAGTALLTTFARIETKAAEAHVAAAKLYLSQSRWALAEEQYRDAIAIDGACSSYHLDLGSVLANEGKLAESEAEIRTAIELAPMDARAHLALGDLMNAESGREDEAEAEFAQARALDPRAVPASSPPVATTSA